MNKMESIDIYNGIINNEENILNVLMHRARLSIENRFAQLLEIEHFKITELSEEFVKNKYINFRELLLINELDKKKLKKESLLDHCLDEIRNETKITKTILELIEKSLIKQNLTIVQKEDLKQDLWLEFQEFYDKTIDNEKKTRIPYIIGICKKYGITIFKKTKKNENVFIYPEDDLDGPSVSRKQTATVLPEPTTDSHTDILWDFINGNLAKEDILDIKKDAKELIRNMLDNYAKDNIISVRQYQILLLGFYPIEDDVTAKILDTTAEVIKSEKWRGKDRIKVHLNIS